MKILIIGRNGQLASSIISKLKTSKNVISIGSKTKIFKGNLLRPKEVADSIIDINPEIIINCSAYTDVNKAIYNKKKVEIINSKSLIEISKAANKINAKLIHFSTDYVYGNYREKLKEDFKNYPINFYGLSKFKGEKNIIKYCKKFLILRVSWLYSNKGKNFLKTILKKYSQGRYLDIVNDQIGTPTSVEFISENIDIIINKISKNKNFNNWGVYNLSPKGYVSWHGFALKIISFFLKFQIIDKKKVKINPISSHEIQHNEKRQSNSVMDNRKINKVFNIKIKHWEEVLKNYIIKNYE